MYSFDNDESPQARALLAAHGKRIQLEIQWEPAGDALVEARQVKDEIHVDLHVSKAVFKRLS